MSNLPLANELYGRFARGQIPQVLASFHSEIQWREAEGNPYQMDGGVWIGPQAVLEKLFMLMPGHWNDFRINIERLHEAGEYVVMEGRYVGTSKESGRSLDAQVCHVLRFRDDKLAAFQQYCDTAQLQAVMAAP